MLYEHAFTKEDAVMQFILGLLILKSVTVKDTSPPRRQMVRNTSCNSAVSHGARADLAV